MNRIIAQRGALDHITDVAGLGLGHAENQNVRTGTTVLVPRKPVAMGVDVRGGGPGTRDTDALNPSCLVDRVHGLVLSGGSVFGLAAADRVTMRLSDAQIGLDLKPRFVPVVPSAILFDLRNGGDKDWGPIGPYGDLADTATTRALAGRADALDNDLRLGDVGAGLGAMAGDRQGGFGSASFTLTDGPLAGLTVSAMVAVNSFGPIMGEGQIADNLDGQSNYPALGDIHTPKMGLVGANTTIGAVATNADLDKAQCSRVAIMAQDGLARSIRPIHTPFDGDTIFALATGDLAQNTGADFHNPVPLPNLLTVIGTLAADALVASVQKAVPNRADA